MTFEWSVACKLMKTILGAMRAITRSAARKDYVCHVIKHSGKMMPSARQLIDIPPCMEEWQGKHSGDSCYGQA